MNRDDFHVGLEFYTAAGKWRCTDIGTRVIVAIKLDQTDESWYNGPPYAVAESVFDEYDLPGCSLGLNEFNVNRGGAWGSHAVNSRLAYRGDGTPDSRGDYLGFRVVRAGTVAEARGQMEAA